MSKIAAEKLVLSVYLPYTRKGILLPRIYIAADTPAFYPLLSLPQSLHSHFPWKSGIVKGIVPTDPSVFEPLEGHARIV